MPIKKTVCLTLHTEQPPQHVQATPARRADVAQGDLQLFSDFLVRHRRLGDQQAQELLTPNGKRLESGPHQRVAFPAEQWVVDRRLVGVGCLLELGHHVSRNLPTLPVEHPHALAPRGRHQPPGKVLRLTQLAEALDEPEPGGLCHVGDVGLAEAEGPANRPHQPGVPPHDLVPRPLVSFCRGLHEIADVARFEHIAYLDRKSARANLHIDMRERWEESWTTANC